MSPYQIVERLAGEWAVIASAPVTFLIAIAAVAAIIWWLTGQFYAARFEGQKETILALEGRIKAKDDDIARKSAQIIDLENKSSQLLSNETVRDPNGIYQGDAQVGVAHGATRNLGAGFVNFTLLDASGDFNASALFDYQDLVLCVKEIQGALARSGGMGLVDRQRLSQVVCRIVSRRS